jgi:hypothetical protein
MGWVRVSAALALAVLADAGPRPLDAPPDVGAPALGAPPEVGP